MRNKLMHGYLCPVFRHEKRARSAWMRVRKTAVVLIGVILLFSGLVGCDSTDAGTKKSIIEKNGRLQFGIDQTRFDIPKKYYKGASGPTKDTVSSVRLWALLPNFEGYDKDINHHDFFEMHHKGRRIQIMLLGRGRVLTVPKIVEKNLRLPYTVLAKHGGEHDEMRYGLEYYRTHQLLIPGDLPGPDSVYIYRKNGTPVLKFRCGEDEQAPYPGCSVNWDYNEEVAVEFDFSKKYLPQWRENLANVEALLGGKIDCC